MWQTNRITVVKFDDILHAVRSIDPGINGTINFYAQTCSSDGLHQTILSFSWIILLRQTILNSQTKCLELPWMEYINFKQLSQAGLFTSLLWVTTFVMGLHDLNILSLTCVVMQKQTHHITRQCHSEAPHFLLRFIPRFLF